jgi:hypothetical protein
MPTKFTRLGDVFRLTRWLIAALLTPRLSRLTTLLRCSWLSQDGQIISSPAEGVSSFPATWRVQADKALTVERLSMRKSAFRSSAAKGDLWSHGSPFPILSKTQGHPFRFQTCQKARMHFRAPLWWNSFSGFQTVKENSI